MEVRISDLLRMAKKRILITVVLAFIAAGVTGWLSFYILAPQYEATATLLLQPQYVDNQINYNDLLAKEKLVPTLGLAITSRKITLDVINLLKLKISEEDLRKHVQVKGIRTSLAILITVTYPDPERATQIANAFAYSSRDNLPALVGLQNISVLNEAKIDPKPASPKPYFNMALVFLLTINLGVGVIILVGVLDKTVKSEELLQSLLKIPVLAVLAKYPRKRKEKEGRLFCLEDPQSLSAEEFKKLRTNLRFMQLNKELSTLLITSALPQEGKSYTAANLAIAMAQEGKRVLLMDCDLRNPSLHKLFDICSEKGLTSVLINQVSGENAVFSTAQKNLDILPCGPVPPNPSELLGMAELADLVNYFKSRYDLVLMDSFAVIPVTDTQLLAKNADAVLLVAKLQGTECQDLMQAGSLLNYVGANLIGAVANYRKVGAARYHQYHQKPAESTGMSGVSVGREAGCS